MKRSIQNIAAPVQRLWSLRSPQERRFLVTAVLLLALALYLWLLQVGSAARVTLEASVLSLRGQAASLEQHAAEFEQLRSLPPVPASELALLPLLQARAATAGLADLLLRSEALDADQASLSFGAIPFEVWLRWIAALQTQNVRVSNARIEALATPGFVSVTATLSRPAPALP